MDKGTTPYIVVNREVETGYGAQKIFVALNLLDHACWGIGLTRDEALKQMVDEFDEKYPED